MTGYTFIKSPWWAMPFEAMECATVSLMVVSFMSYASVLSTPATIVTLQGMYGGLYNGVGELMPTKILKLKPTDYNLDAKILSCINIFIFENNS